MLSIRRNIESMPCKMNMYWVWSCYELMSVSIEKALINIAYPVVLYLA
jgi:hypothetical protein